MVNVPSYYQDVQIYTDFQKLLAGDYIVKIKDVQAKHNDDNSTQLIFFFDIAEGEFENHFQKKVDKFGGNLARIYATIPREKKVNDTEEEIEKLKKFAGIFKSMVNNFEVSNKFFKWDLRNEKMFIGLKIGAVAENSTFADKETGNPKQCIKWKNFKKISEIKKDSILQDNFDNNFFENQQNLDTEINNFANTPLPEFDPNQLLMDSLLSSTLKKISNCKDNNNDITNAVFYYDQAIEKGINGVDLETLNSALLEYFGKTRDQLAPQLK